MRHTSVHLSTATILLRWTHLIHLRVSHLALHLVLVLVREIRRLAPELVAHFHASDRRVHHLLSALGLVYVAQKAKSLDLIWVGIRAKGLRRYPPSKLRLFARVDTALLTRVGIHPALIYIMRHYLVYRRLVYVFQIRVASSQVLRQRLGLAHPSLPKFGLHGGILPLTVDILAPAWSEVLLLRVLGLHDDLRIMLLTLIHLAFLVPVR